MPVLMMRYSLRSRRLNKITLWSEGEPIVSFAQFEMALVSEAPSLWRVTVVEFWWDETPLSRANVKVSSAVAREMVRRRASGKEVRE